MRIKVLAFAASLLLIANSSAGITQSPTTPTASSPQAAMLLVQSAKALGGSVNLNNATLSGKVRRIAGSDDETGSVVLTATTGGDNRMDLSFASGNSSEVRTSAADGPAGAWTGPDGVQHAAAHHNLLTDSTWFIPALTMGHLLSAKNIVTTYVGHETAECGTVEHLRIAQEFAFQPGREKKKLEELTTMDLFLDSKTLLPTCLAFNTHPDDDANTDIPVSILFSDYRLTNGVQMPFHVQKFLNNSLHIDIVIDTATVN